MNFWDIIIVNYTLKLLDEKKKIFDYKATYLEISMPYSKHRNFILKFTIIISNFESIKLLRNK